MSLTHVRDLYTSTFLRQGSISLVRHRTLDVSTTTANAVVDFDWHHLIAKLSTCISVRCKDLGDICCTSWGIAHFVSNFVAMATKVGRGGIWFAAFYSPIPKKNPVRCTDFVFHTRRVISHFVQNSIVVATSVSQGLIYMTYIKLADPENHTVEPKITQPELWQFKEFLNFPHRCHSNFFNF